MFDTKPPPFAPALPKPEVFDVEVPATVPPALPPAREHVFSTYASSSSTPFWRYGSTASKILVAIPSTIGREEEAIFPAVCAACETVCCTLDGGGGSATTTVMDGVSVCESAAEVPSIRAASRCSPAFGFHSMECIWLSPAGSSSSRTPMRSASSLKTNVPLSALVLPLYTTAETTSVSPATAGVLETHMARVGTKKKTNRSLRNILNTIY